MNSSTMKRFITLTAMLSLLVATVLAYPPAPYHTFYGTVRNEWGDPIDVSGAKIFIQSSNGAGATASVTASTQPGVNYRLTVPMDSNRSLKVEPPSALNLRKSQPIQLKITVGPITYVPVEMVLSRPLGDPAGTTRLDLTLGVDTDGDGLPDAWEVANGLNPNDPNDADGDADGDGVSNRNEYLAGTAPYDPSDGFRLTLVSVDHGNTTLEFFAIRGRTYSVQSSTNLQQWTPVSFSVLSGGVPGTLQSNYTAADVRMLQVQVPAQAGATNRSFKALLQ